MGWIDLWIISIITPQLERRYHLGIRVWDFVHRSMKGYKIIENTLDNSWSWSWRSVVSIARRRMVDRIA